ncbi:hypothetical protein F511_21220 [Dorcoceras hygrometricum]|uniref:Uncharacterized protein n=1 Tax=Dorcoceras hygrometricum TaxID=472368 RepID=A0A2Z7CMD0_9LAMI|nr:hypothetical protein F511_21220 [Dorcoceras hygrometricum]
MHRSWRNKLRQGLPAIGRDARQGVHVAAGNSAQQLRTLRATLDRSHNLCTKNSRIAQPPIAATIAQLEVAWSSSNWPALRVRNGLRMTAPIGRATCAASAPSRALMRVRRRRAAAQGGGRRPRSKSCLIDFNLKMRFSQGNRHFTVGDGRLRQSGPRPEGRLLRQPALEGLTRSARTDSPRQVGRNKFRRGGGGGVHRRRRREPALEGLTRSARTDSPRQVGRNKFRRGGGGGVHRRRRREV